MQDVKEIMGVWRRPSVLDSGTVAEHCSNCLFWEDGLCLYHASNIGEVSWDKRCDEYSPGVEGILNG